MARKDTNISPSLRQILTTPSTAALETFDAWNSVGTGHQRAELNQTNSSGWNKVRSQKLSAQYGKGRDGNAKAAAEAGEWVLSDKAGRKKLGRFNDGNGDIRSFMGGVKKRRVESEKDNEVAKRLRTREEQGFKRHDTHDDTIMSLERSKGAISFDRDDLMNANETNTSTSIHASNDSNDRDKDTNKEKRIFANLTIYINGSTLPLISDHKLKNTLIDHGAKISIGLARRSVTHVILGCPNGNVKGNDDGISNGGAGGGLAAGKLQREISRVGGMGVKFVGVEWVLESIKAGCRLPEARFANLHLASSKQRSVLDFTVK
ncbi:uncharacterized protein GIQ15_00681 [Arthroderma uncinatum]|uniref:uncharacterized protein n=1 Tax=Arthroderma uncinatum TaxID=74035 RepID=UPI00144A96AC|nr:uncharacterized protein GIQ15_00681 [Arthroderma uncinatum]KAF3491164.1 hypothetical protein GIQ15_00681 [Arthroderma uncinatum]